MSSRFFTPLARSLKPLPEEGFSLTEGVIASVIFTAAMVAGLPTFMQFQLKAATNEDRVGAVAVSQQLLDAIRLTDVATLPNSGSVTTLPDGSATNSLNYRGQSYQATITYCQNASLCDANARQIIVQVSQNGRTLYAVETLYAKFD